MVTIIRLQNKTAMIAIRHTLIFVLSMVLASTTAVADVYRAVDGDGNVIFSDHPSPDAKKVEVEPTNVIPPVKLKPVTSTTTSKESKFKYELLQITTPEHDTTLRNISNLSVAAQLVPALQEQHKIQFTDNGTPLKDPSRSLAIRLFDVARGTHRYQVQILDEKGTILITSAPVSVHIHKTSILNNRSKAP